MISNWSECCLRWFRILPIIFIRDQPQAWELIYISIKISTLSFCPFFGFCPDLGRPFFGRFGLCLSDDRHFSHPSQNSTFRFFHGYSNQNLWLKSFHKKKISILSVSGILKMIFLDWYPKQIKSYWYDRDGLFYLTEEVSPPRNESSCCLSAWASFWRTISPGAKKSKLKLNLEAVGSDSGLPFRLSNFQKII